MEPFKYSEEPEHRAFEELACEYQLCETGLYNEKFGKEQFQKWAVEHQSWQNILSRTFGLTSYDQISEALTRYLETVSISKVLHAVLLLDYDSSASEVWRTVEFEAALQQAQERIADYEEQTMLPYLLD